jgi:hypothetical protein
LRKHKIYFLGGFGNVLFQLTLYISLKHDGYHPVIIDVLTKKNFITNFLKLNIHEAIFKEIANDLNIKFYRQTKIQTIFIIALAFVSKVSKRQILFTYFFRDNFKKSNLVNSLNLFGYFQNKNFLESNKKHILTLSKTLQNRYNKINLNNQSIVVVHYRYGDSVWAKKCYDYYVSVKKRVKTKKSVIIVTDSINEANIFFSDLKVDSSQIINNSSLEDFSYMVSAAELYCAPSTFSWWAAHCLKENCKVFLPFMIYKKLGFWNEKVKFEIL